MICCKKCGTAKANGAEYCLFCGNKFPKVITPEWNDNGSVDVYLSGQKYTIAPYNTELFDDIREFSQEFAREMSEFMDVFPPNAGDYFDNVFQKAIPCLFKLVLKCANYFYDWLYAKGVKDISEDEFIDDATNFDFDDDLEEFSDWSKEVNEEINKIYLMRGAQRSSRSRWQGGGFGFKGAIKGAIQAGILNFGTDLIRGIGDSYIDSRDAKRIRDFKIKTGLDINPIITLSMLLYRYFSEIMLYAIGLYEIEFHEDEIDDSKESEARDLVIQTLKKHQDSILVDKEIEDTFKEALTRLIVLSPFDPYDYIHFIEYGNGEPHEIETIINMNGMAEFVEVGLYLEAAFNSFMLERFFTELSRNEKINYLNQLGRIVFGCSNMHEEKKIRQIYYKYQEKMKEMNIIK